jgi:AcrR family transcriptional regulator
MTDSVIIRAMRRRPPDGLEQVIAAAVRVFGDKGYRRTQMADVARAMGVAPGTLYGYVTGKEALFHLVVDRAFTEGGRPAPALPIAAPPPGTTLARVRERLTSEVALPALQAALRRRRHHAAGRELEAVVGQLYDRIAGTWPGIIILERSALEWPELAQVFYGDVRRGLLARLERYLTARMNAGLLRPAPSATGAALFILETIAWFAMHRHRHRGGADIDDATARGTTIALLVNALAPGRQRPATRKESRR